MSVGHGAARIVALGLTSAFLMLLIPSTQALLIEHREQRTTLSGQRMLPMHTTANYTLPFKIRTLRRFRSARYADYQTAHTPTTTELITLLDWKSIVDPRARKRYKWEIKLLIIKTWIKVYVQNEGSVAAKNTTFLPWRKINGTLFAWEWDVMAWK